MNHAIGRERKSVEVARADLLRSNQVPKPTNFRLLSVGKSLGSAKRRDDDRRKSIPVHPDLVAHHNGKYVVAVAPNKEFTGGPLGGEKSTNVAHRKGTDDLPSRRFFEETERLFPGIVSAPFRANRPPADHQLGDRLYELGPPRPIKGLAAHGVPCRVPDARKEAMSVFGEVRIGCGRAHGRKCSMRSAKTTEIASEEGSAKRAIGIVRTSQMGRFFKP
jgi:hypothetical protein